MTLKQRMKNALVSAFMAIVFVIGTSLAISAQCTVNCPSPITVNTGSGNASCYLTGVTCQQGCTGCTCNYGNCGPGPGGGGGGGGDECDPDDMCCPFLED